MPERFHSWADIEAALDGYHGLDEPTPRQAAAFALLRQGVMHDGRTFGEYLDEAGRRGMPTEPGRPDDLGEIRARLDAMRAELARRDATLERAAAEQGVMLPADIDVLAANNLQLSDKEFAEWTSAWQCNAPCCRDGEDGGDA